MDEHGGARYQGSEGGEDVPEGFSHWDGTMLGIGPGGFPDCGKTTISGNEIKRFRKIPISCGGIDFLRFPGMMRRVGMI
jgi:hypothetical protein